MSVKDPLRPVSASLARQLLHEALAAIEVGRETVGLEAAAGRVLAEPLVAPEDLPAFPRAAMDGYAVRAEDIVGAATHIPVPLAVVGEVAMGASWPGVLAAGQAVAIPTGGQMPAGADAVVMIEHTTREEDGHVAVRCYADPGRHVVGRGEDIRRGAVVLPAGRRLGPPEVGALAAFGLVDVRVVRRPRVAVLSTGNELCPPRATPAPGQVRDINQHVLSAQAAEAGCEVTCGGIVADEPSAIEAAVRALVPSHQVILLSGGTSVGSGDHTADVFARLGAPGVIFHGIDVRPGRPTLLARAGKTLLVGMPGVPASSIVIFQVFIGPILRRMGGETGEPRWPAQREARLSRNYLSAFGREDYVRVRLVDRQGEIWTEPLPGGSAVITSVLDADGLVIVPPEVERMEEGEPVTVLLRHAGAAGVG